MDGVCRPEVEVEMSEEPGPVVVRVNGVSDPDEIVKSEIFRFFKIGRSHRRTLVCCACRASVACFTRVDEDKDFCSITSDKLRFLSMGFLAPNELLRDRFSVKGADSGFRGFALPG